MPVLHNYGCISNLGMFKLYTSVKKENFTQAHCWWKPTPLFRALGHLYQKLWPSQSISRTWSYSCTGTEAK